MSDSYDVFISHSTSSVSFGQELFNELRKRGVRPFYDVFSITSGSTWESAIRDALVNSRAVVFVVDQKSASSEWTAFELGAALGMDKKVVSVLAPDVPTDSIPTPLKGFQTILKRTPSEAATEVIKVLESSTAKR